MSRGKLFLLWMLCTVVTPVLILAMLAQAIGGSAVRAQSMAVAFDECGNSLFGGPPQMTISSRTGNGLIEGQTWAKLIAPCIDFVFGKGHCLSQATKKPEA